MHFTTRRENSLELLKQRFPDLAFLLTFFPSDSAALPTDSQPLCDWVDGLDLEKIEVVYLIGLIDYDLPVKLQEWLREKKERVIVFIEDELGAFAPFSENELLSNPQVHFHYASEDPVEALAKQFPTEFLAIYEGKPFDAQRLQRRSSAFSALYSDVLYSHKIVENVLCNMQRLDGAFDARGKFDGVPAVICGAGPSLEEAFPVLEKLKTQALVFAGGTAVAAMTKKGIKPHFAMALDPNNEEFERLKQANYFEGPFLFAPRLHQSVFATANGPYGYMKTDTGGLVENWLEKELGLSGDPVGPDLGDEAFSVTTLAISYAFALGCNPIILTGVDLAYTGGHRYVSGIGAGEENQVKIQAKDIYGREIETQLKWIMESECIGAFAQKNPETVFLNASKGGIGIPGVENTPLEKALADSPHWDLEGDVHQWVQMQPLDWNKDKLGQVLGDLIESLNRCTEITQKILKELEKKKESGRLTLFESDFSEELAYDALLEGISLALDHLLVRYFPNLDPEKGKWDRKVAKYQEILRQIKKFDEILIKA